MPTKELAKEFQEAGLLITQEDISCIASLKATNRQVLVDAVNYAVRECNIPEDGVYLRVELSGGGLGCNGGSVDYKTEDDIPYHSVPCPCDNPKHWLIKYDEEPPKQQCKLKIYQS